MTDTVPRLSIPTPGPPPTVVAVAPGRSRFSVVSMVLGFLLGVLLTLLLVFIAYAQRLFLFSYCANEAKACVGTDYYNDPGAAIAAGANPDGLFFLNDNQQMFYQRPILPGITCIPVSDQTVPITYPQYCDFTLLNGEHIVGQQVADQSPIYLAPTLLLPISTSGNCTPVSGASATSGVPLLRWDAD